MTPDDRRRARAFLETNPMRHLVHLKFLHLYGDAIDCFYHEEGQETGVLLSYPTALISRDAGEYPQAAYVLLPVASGEVASLALRSTAQAYFGTCEQLVIKFCDSAVRQVFEGAFQLVYAKSVLSFTTEHNRSPLPGRGDVKVVAAARLDEACAPLYARNSYTREQINQYFADNGQSFTIYESGQPVCTCLVFRNFGAVWEIGALHTVEPARRKGYARRVVGEAIRTILQNGWIPRYQTEESNTASTALAESLGMRQCLRFEHYLASPTAT